MKKILFLLTLISLPSFACDLSFVGKYTCYNDKNKTEELYSLEIEKRVINDHDGIKLSRQFKGNTGKSIRYYSMGKFSRTLTDQMKKEAEKIAIDNIYIDPFDWMSGQSGFASKTYEGENTCTIGEIKLNRIYYQVEAVTNEHLYKSNVKHSIAIKKDSKLITVKESFQNQAEGQNGYTPGKSYSDYCFKN